jgi:hypothetical protein
MRKKRSKNGVGILIDKSLKNEVVAIRRQGDRIISAYAPQVGLNHDVKRRFWEDL